MIAKGQTTKRNGFCYKFPFPFAIFLLNFFSKMIPMRIHTDQRMHLWNFKQMPIKSFQRKTKLKILGPVVQKPVRLTLG